MPLVLRVKAFKLYFYSKEGPRCHVHVKHISGTEVVVWLDDFTLKKTSGDKRVDAVCIKLAFKYQRVILDSWYEHFGVSDEKEK